jgi:membrane protease YdiL (CAAX protease family)
MLAIAADSLQAADHGLLILGGLITLAATVRHIRRRGAADPLSDSPLPGPPIAAVQVLAAILAYFALASTLAVVFTRGATDAERGTPGSGAWHCVQMADGIGKLAVALGVALLMTHLAARPAAPRADAARRPPGMRLWRGLGIGLLALPAISAISTLQLAGAKLVWRWLDPHAEQPLHVVLRALQNSAWNDFGPQQVDWGTIQLCVAAVLIAPLAEEYFFRGLLLGLFATWTRRKWLAVILSAAAFGAVHSQPQDIVPLFTMGLLLGALRVGCGSLAPCIVVHALFNARTMIAAIAAPELLTE